ncbi:hypothetical protein BBJ28_00013122 [Nothophytophthora sp. Chile5]|nr:hypothetical protein BBJ28_00013122 [Nothophytophthora sp. Chile5]
MPSSGLVVSIEAEAEASRDGETDDAREWWGQRELKVERELTIGLRRRMEAQRAQIHAFKTEQSKWEHELQRLRQWDRFHRAESAAAAKAQTTQQEELLAEVERVLAVAGDETAVWQQLGDPSELETTKKPSGARTSRIKGRGDEEDSPCVTRIKELEAACKQKVREVSMALTTDVSVCQITVVERQETAFDEKLKLVTAKYDQVKAINMALQVR